MKLWNVTRDNGEDEEVIASDMNITESGALEFRTSDFCETPRTFIYIAGGTWRDCHEVSQ